MNAWFERFAKKEGLDQTALWKAIELAEQGSIDADLGGHVIKQRVARSGGGKSGGYRTVILYRKEERAFFVYGFPKSARANIEEDEERAFKKMAKHVLNLSDTQLEKLVKSREFKEVKRNGEKEIQE
ncbi:hypothetical protein FHX06_001422 [Rhizobium sp. BK512]|uniref:type II toxin-antitoxin system RelE/ParE family toxin n=1 Tax=Rhizobium sp. BK512 TaxID=2587010 RepID=UPI00180EBF69|nr:type II toxin-antitoxin system RelE/ParE family toxin [Rhizobium sp. BK512]MBB3560111.1 hypothetical protein [Rhizobium sp. BK512]